MNGDDGGKRSYSRTVPVAALHWHPSDTHGMHLAWGRGFETPTFNELSYRADGAAGLPTAADVVPDPDAERADFDALLTAAEETAHA